MSRRVSPRVGEEFKAKGNEFDSVVIQKDKKCSYKYQVIGIVRNGNDLYMKELSEKSRSLAIARRELRKYAKVEFK